MKLLVINGPNLNMLGIRERALYGAQDYAALCDFVRAQAERLGVSVELFQSNHEGAILDALKAVSIPACEVHLTDVNAREDFRKVSYVRMACDRTFAGFGFDGYRMAMEYLVERYGKPAE